MSHYAAVKKKKERRKKKGNNLCALLWSYFKLILTVQKQSAKKITMFCLLCRKENMYQLIFIKKLLKISVTTKSGTSIDGVRVMR